MTAPTERAAELGRISREAGRIAQEARKSLSTELKSDGSIVTNADKAVETWLRSELPKFYTGATIWGEEFGYEEPGENGFWVLDPIDGTSNFNFGSPLWGVSIGLVNKGVIELGAVYLPDLDELYLGERGKGSFFNSELIPQIPAGPVKPFELVSYGDHILRKYPDMKVPGKMRLGGAFVVDGSFVPIQRLRGMVGMRERLYDIAACVLIAEEAGAEVRYVDGSPFDIEEISHPVQISKPWLIFPADNGFYG